MTSRDLRPLAMRTLGLVLLVALGVIGPANGSPESDDPLVGVWRLVLYED
jgi:hypothetical protein